MRRRTDSFSARLKWRRRTLDNMSQRTLAAAAGVSHGSIQALEAGDTSPSIKTVEALATALGVSAAWLAFGAEGDAQTLTLDVAEGFDATAYLDRIAAEVESNQPIDQLAKYLDQRGVRRWLDLLRSQNYVADRRLATAVFLSLKLGRPLFLEGEAGVGKTEIAKVLAAAQQRRLVRLQCYEGLDTASAVYEWNYPRQMIEIRLAEAGGHVVRDELAHDIFTTRFLLKRPILEALAPPDGVAPVLLIDELDRADEPFEAYLLEVLAEYQVTIPELGPIRAAHPPMVVITSNRTREIHDAIKRRCLYHWVDYPDAARELEIVRRKCPQAPESLARELVAFTQRLRTMDLFKAPGVAETLDWAEALVALDRVALDPAVVGDTIGVLLKYQDDVGAISPAVAARLVAEAQEGGVRL